MTDERPARATDMGAADAKRLELAEEYLNQFPGATRHHRLGAALRTLVEVAGPPIDVACSIFAQLVTGGVEEGRCDVYCINDPVVVIYGGDGSAGRYLRGPDGELVPAPDPDPEPEPGSVH